MALSISNIVNVQLNTIPKSAARKNFGVVALFTPEAGTAFADSKTRYVYVDSQQQVESLFGSNSETAKASLPFFAQSPRAATLIICRWNKRQTSIRAVNNALRGGVLNNTLAQFKKVNDGYFAINIGGTLTSVSGVDLTQAADLNAVATKLTEKLTGFTVTFDSVANRFIATSKTAGEHQATTIYFAEDNGADGTYLGAMLKWQDGQAERVVGVSASTVPAESAAEALNAVAEVNNAWYGLTFAAQLTNDEIEAAAKFAQANTKLFGVTATLDSHLVWNSATNIFKKLKDASMDHTLAIFDRNDPYAVTSALARLLSMNFGAQNSTITLKFKTQPTITADEITATEMNAAKRLGINVYTYFDDVAMIAEGTVIGGKFADEIVILDWFADAVQKEVFARLYKSPTKIPLTDKGQAILISAVEKVCLEGVNNGAFAAGLWTGDSFGALSTGDYLEQGYYVWAAPMDTLSDSDREQRRATPIQTAVKLAGAIHFSDVIINFNR